MGQIYLHNGYSNMIRFVIYTLRTKLPLLIIRYTTVLLLSVLSQQRK